jgi:hypothetical protein
MALRVLGTLQETGENYTFRSFTTYNFPIVTLVNKTIWIRWEGYTARKGENRNTQVVLVRGN